MPTSDPYPEVVPESKVRVPPPPYRISHSDLEVAQLVHHLSLPPSKIIFPKLTKSRELLTTHYFHPSQQEVQLPPHYILSSRTTKPQCLETIVTSRNLRPRHERRATSSRARPLRSPVLRAQELWQVRLARCLRKRHSAFCAGSLPRLGDSGSGSGCTPVLCHQGRDRERQH
jgi:hypothetical protein